MASKFDVESIGLFLILVIGLALTPTIGSSLTDSKFLAFTDIKNMGAVGTNTTTLTYTPRNDSATYAYFAITLNATSFYGSLIVNCANNISVDVATKVLTFIGCLNNTVPYTATINYYYQAITGSSSALLDLVPLLWVIGLIATIIVFSVRKLRLSG